MNAVGVLDRKVSKLTQEDWTGVKRLGRWLTGTMDFNLKLSVTNPPKHFRYTVWWKIILLNCTLCLVQQETKHGSLIIYKG